MVNHIQVNQDYIESLCSNKNLKYGELKIEMTIDQSAFLIGLLKRKKAAKILELGVASGGTSFLLLSTINNNQYLYSVDISRTLYSDDKVNTGYIADRELNYNDKRNWVRYFGYDIVDIISEIGPEIDFVILDTNHCLPGELLQFLIIMPYIKDNAVIVMHDLSLNKRRSGSGRCGYMANAYATKVLFNGIVSNQKYMPLPLLANIGAVIFDAANYEYTLETLFESLTYTWFYYPESIDAYQEYIEVHYDFRYSDLFKEITKFQKSYFSDDGK